MIGTTVGHFRIEKKLGAGGMGEVYRARDTKLGRDVALKLLPETSPDKLARFEREARAVAGLAHPNIVVLFAIEEFDSRHFLVLELVEGQDLSELVAPGGLPLGKVLDLAIPLADALASAHERGVVHRDLKPSNIKLARDGRVKVLDFGLAKLLDSDRDLDVTAPVSGAGQVLGTIPYMAPEQIRGEGVDARADLFAFGVIVYELATGRRPFAGTTLADISSSILRDVPAPLRTLRAELPAELERVVERCLAKNPRERYQSALDVANDLRRISAGKSASPERSADEVSIAVLPFANRSASADDEYFADGLADELLGVLARIRGIRVIARTSSARFKGATEDAASIGRQLNVSSLLEGTVRKSGNRVRIGVQLVRAESGEALWSQTYDRTLEDVFAVQDEIAQSVVKELRRTLLGEADDSDASREAKVEVAKAAALGRSTNPEAQDLFLRARHIGQLSTAESFAHAVRLLERAVELDPGFAAGWAELGSLHSLAGQFAGHRDATEAHLKSAHRAIEKAIEIAPDFGPAHAHLARLRFADMDWQGARASIRRALELSPTDPVVMNRAGMFLYLDGRVEEAERLYLDILRVEPLNPAIHHNHAAVHRVAGRLEEAVESYRKELELAPGGAASHADLAVTLSRMGRNDEALLEVERERIEPFRLWARALILDASGRRQEADVELAALIDAYGIEAAAQVAEIHGARGNADEAFAWLQKAWDARDAGVFEAKTSAFYRNFHDDPRWPEFLRTVGFES